MVALRLCLHGGATDGRCQPERLRACDSGVAYAAIGRSLVLLQRKNFYSVLKKSSDLTYSWGDSVVRIVVRFLH